MRPPRVPAPQRHDPAHSSAHHPVDHPVDLAVNHSAQVIAKVMVKRMTRHLPTPLLGLALLAFMPQFAGPLACASGTGTPPPAHRNNAERPPPFATAPDFTVSDATGTPRDLASLMGPKGLVLVLYRGHW